LARSDLTPQRDVPARTGRRVVEIGPQPLNEIEGKILEFMVQYLRANTYQPSIREIGERFGIKSTKTVSEHLQALADKGFLERDPSRSRGVKILGMDLTTETVQVPCFREMPDRRAAAGGTEAESTLALDRRLAGERGSFFVRAGAGDLAVVGVNEGDYVLVEPASLAEMADGTIVVAHIGTGSWYHRLLRNGSSVQLAPLRTGGEATSVEDVDSVLMVGRVTAFFRVMDDSAGAVNLTHH